jgi:AAA domain, putative AbiEii toxin, Type IV TA system
VTTPEPVHALILTSNGDDLDGVLGLFDRMSSARLIHPNGWTCWRCGWRTDEGEDLVIAVAHVAVMQGVSSVSKFEDLRVWLRPTWLFHCGTAYPSKRPAVVFVTHLLTGEQSVNTLDSLPMRARVVLNELLTGELKKTDVYTSGVELLDADADRGSDLPTAIDDAITPLLPLLTDARCLFLRGHDESTGAFDAAGVALKLLGALTAVHADNHPRVVPRGSVVDEATLALFDDVTVDHLAVRDFKNISSLDLDLDRSAASSFGGRWLCLAGVNGAGKSAVLQSLVLGLLGPRYAAELGGASLQRMRRDLAGAPQDARIEVTVRLGDSRHVVPLPITARGATAVEGIDRATHERIWEARAPRHLLLAYGPGRNLSEHIDSRHDGKSEEVRRVITLFDPLAQVASAEAILRARDDAAAIVKTARGLLAEVLEESLVALDEPDTALRFRMGDTRLGAVDLPDGFRSTIAWLVDLCASWHAIAPARAASGDHREIRALVVIDEIDLHLHPRLQRVLVPRLRKALPRVQWIVSTHSPLVLGCFDRREIVMLERDDAGHVTQRAVDRQVAGFSTDEIYEWLMDTPPRSAAIDALRRPDGTFTPEAVRLLAQSPAHDEASVARAYAFQQSRARGPVAQGLRDEPTTAGDGEEPSR